MKGTGVDVQLTSLNLDKRLRWTTNGLFSYAAAEVTHYDLPVGYGISYLGSGTINPVEGKPVYGIYSYRWGGLNDSTGAAQGIIDGKQSVEQSS